MIESFDAFISYKHAPVDNKAAEEIQNYLEHYHVPAKLAKKLGKKRIERIFRDKAELPITSSLSDNIAYALEHSDFLIVICSHSTKLSAWVPREIDYFLKFHPINHVLTVLAEGEPQDVIPEQLLKTTVIKTDDDGTPLLADDGTPVTEELLLEPLSCDWRMPLRKARQEELPRLAAAILGCSYDELIMRARQYKKRRLTIILGIAASMAAVAIGYLLWSNAQIRENLRQAQINRATYLANASQTILEQEHDGVGSVQLALASVESTGNAASAIPESIYALSKAVYAFSPEQAYDTSYVPNKKYSMGSFVQDMQFSADKKTIFLVDEAAEVRAYDVSSQELLFSRSFEDVFNERMSILPVENDRLLICDGISLHMFSWKDNKELWTFDLWKDSSGNTLSVHVPGSNQLNNYRNIGLVWKESFPDVAMALSPDKTTLAVDGTNDTIRLIDTASGAETDRISLGFKVGENSDYLLNSIQKIIWSENARQIAVLFMYTDYGVSYQVGAAVYDTETKICRSFYTEESSWEDMCFAGPDRLLLLAEGDIMLDDLSKKRAGINGNSSFIYSCSSNAYCFSAADDAVLWKTALSWERPWEVSGSCLYDAAGDFGTESAIFAISDKGYAVDMQSGEILASQTFSLPILNIVTVTGKKAWFFLTDGELASLRNPQEGSFNYQEPTLLDTGTAISLKKLVRVPDEPNNMIFMCLQNSCKDVIGFSIVGDSDGKELDGILLDDYPENNWVYKGRVISVLSDKVCAADISSGEQLFEVSLGSYKLLAEFAPGDLITESDDMAVIVYDEQNNYYCLLINSLDGTVQNIPLEQWPITCRNGILFMLKSDKDGSDQIIKYSLKDRTSETVRLNMPEGKRADALQGFIVSPDAKRVALTSEDKTLFIADLQSGDCRVMKNEAANTNFFVWSMDNKYYALVSNTSINIYRLNGEAVSSVPTGGRQFIAAYFEADSFYVVYNTASLFKYRIQDGKEEGTAQIGLYSNSQNNAYLLFQDGYLFLNVGTQSRGRMSVIDLDTMKMIKLIDGCVDFSPDTGCFIVLDRRSDKKYHYVSFPNYTTEDLIRKGKEFIGGNTPSSEMISRFGLD